MATRRRSLQVLGVLGGVVAVAVALLWWNYPAHEIERDLRGLRMPPGITLAGEEIDDEGWDCFDSCSIGYRYYTTTLPAKETTDAVVAALRGRGFTTTVERCKEDCLTGAMPPELDKQVYEVSFSKSGSSGYAYVGNLIDGTGAVEVAFGP